MKKSTTAAVNEFVALVGEKTWTKTCHACTGKWRGTYDHSIVIDGRLRLFVTNGMTYFEERIREWYEAIKRFRIKKEEFLHVIRKQVELDNRKAREEGLLTIEVADVGILSPETTDRWFFFIRMRCSKSATGSISSWKAVCHMPYWKASSKYGCRSMKSKFIPQAVFRTLISYSEM